MSRFQPGTSPTARLLFSLLVRASDAEFVLGDLEEDAAARVRAGAPPRAVRRWYIRQLARSAPPLWADAIHRRRSGHARDAGAGRATRGRSMDHAGESRPRPATGARLAGRARLWGRAATDALRDLGRSPGRALAVVVIMALGVGANATMFGALDRLFLRPPAHIDSPDQVKRVFVHLRRDLTGEMGINSVHTYPDYADWGALEIFSSAAAYSSRQLTIGSGAAAERRPVTLVTASFFRTLGARPVLGRFFGDEEDTFGAQPVAVLGHAYWQRELGGDPDVLGRVLEVGDLSYAVIGVAPPGFTGVDLDRVDVWLPLHRAAVAEEGGTEWRDSRGWYWIEAVARLAPGVAPQAAEAVATRVHRNGRAENPNYDPEATVEMAELNVARTGEASREARVVPWLMGVALMVLLLTCANVANLLLARAMRRRRETAVRRALGASRGRLVLTGMLEAVLLSLAGGAAAVAVALWGGDVFQAVLLGGAEWERGVDAVRVVAFSAGLAILAGLFAGLVPALRASRADTAGALKGSGRGTTRGRSRLRSGLLVLQAAISVVLLIGTGLFVASLRAARGVDLGFDPEGVLMVRLQPEGGYPGAEAMTALYREARRALEGLPGIERSAITTVVPFRNSRGIGSDLRIPGLDSLPRTAAGGAYIHAVSGGYFETLGLDLVRGRGIAETDDAQGAPRVAVVNETMARLVWPAGDAMGGCLLLLDAPCATVVGIVEDSHRFELEEAESMHYYVPLSHAPYPWPPSGLMVRAGSPAALAATVQRRLNTELAGVRLVTSEPYRNTIDPSYGAWRLGATLFLAFGLLALIVASVGLYSVLAFEVAERRPELGVRSALGATRGRLVRLVLGEGLRIAALGIGIGLAAGWWAAGRAESLLFGVSPHDPWVLAAVAGAMLLVSTLACGLPAWRAARVDPNETLRTE